MSRPSQAEELWAQARAQLQLELNRGLYETWVREIVPLELSAAPPELRLGVKSVYARTWLENRLTRQVNEVLAKVAGAPLTAVFEVLAAAAPAGDGALEPARGERCAADWVRLGLPEACAAHTLETLDWNFGALQALSAGAQADLQRYVRDPLPALNANRGLFLYGPPGTGKTHLAAVVARRALAAGWRVHFTRPGKFLQRRRAVIDRSRRKELGETEAQIMAELIDADLLALDDLELSDCNEYGRGCLSEVIKARAERAVAPILVTSNYAPEELFRAGLPESVLDRLVPEEIYELNGPSYRAESARRNRARNLIIESGGRSVPQKA